MPYKKEQIKYDVFHRDTLEYILKLVEDPLLAPYIHYDAIRLYRYNGVDFERFVTEPITADHAWNLQVYHPFSSWPCGLGA